MASKKSRERAIWSQQTGLRPQTKSNNQKAINDNRQKNLEMVNPKRETHQIRSPKLNRKTRGNPGTASRRNRQSRNPRPGFGEASPHPQSPRGKMRAQRTPHAPFASIALASIHSVALRASPAANLRSYYASFISLRPRETSLRPPKLTQQRKKPPGYSRTGLRPFPCDYVTAVARHAGLKDDQNDRTRQNNRKTDLRDALAPSDRKTSRSLPLTVLKNRTSGKAARPPTPVSYTHLTLPTICSV